jgi:hypothetical protein
MAVADIAVAATSLAKNGRLDQSTLLSTASSAATMVGMRLIPGVGWAAAAYTVADLGSRAMLGKPFGETMVGKPIDWALDKAGRTGLAAATGALDLVGWKGGSDFLKNTVYPWAYPGTEATPDEAGLTAAERASNRIAQAKESGLLPQDPMSPILIKGPAVSMNAADTDGIPSKPSIEALPLKDGRIDLAALAEHGSDHSGKPGATEVEQRRSDLLAKEHQVMSAGHSEPRLEASLGASRSTADLAAALSQEASTAPSHLPKEQERLSTRASERGYDD